MTPDAAEKIAIHALSWMAADDEILGAFLDAAGAAPGDLRTRAADPEFLGFVLDFLLTSDDMTRAFAEAANIAPETPFQARAHLPGGDLPNWT